MSFRVLSPTGILGYGFPEESFRFGMSRKPDLIAVDAGSTDPGPYYLGAGVSFTQAAAVERDLAILLDAAVEASIPLVIGSAGGAGARPHLDWTREILLKVARERGLAFRLGVIPADVPKATVLAGLNAGHVEPLEAVPPLTESDVADATNIVAQMGSEPVAAAFDEGCQVVLCGRAYDAAPFAAPPIRAGYPAGLALHMGKILECAAIAADPGSGRDCVLGELSENDFVLESLNPARRFTRSSTAAHTLYEKSDPRRLPGPGGHVALDGCVFEELPEGRVRVSGSEFVATPEYWVKLEGAKPVGYRSVCIAGIRDSILIAQIDEVLETIRRETLGGDPEADGAPRLLFHVYGKNAVMGEIEPRREHDAHELGLVIEAIASTQAESDEIVASARSGLLHHGYPGRVSTAGNLAMLFSPSDIPYGPVFRFCVYHLLKVDDPAGLFPVEVVEVGA